MLRRMYPRPTMTASPTHASDSATFTARKVRVPSAKWTVIQTRAADIVSPARLKNVSMTCFALYFASRVVTSQRLCCVVLDSE